MNILLISAVSGDYVWGFFLLAFPPEKGGTSLPGLSAEVSLSLWIPLGIHTWVQFNLHLYIFKNKTTYLLMMWYSNSFVRDCLILIPSFLASKGWDIFSSLCMFSSCYASSNQSLLLKAFFLCLIKELMVSSRHYADTMCLSFWRESHMTVWNHDMLYFIFIEFGEGKICL